MASLHASLSTGRLRIYTPALYDDGAPGMKQREQDRCQLLLKIQGHYKEALERLTGSDVLRRSLHSGVCVGLLDPVSNIIVNALLAATEDRAPAPVAINGPEDSERHSLDGLVTFLTCFFPYLADWEAVRYLLLAEADPLVAARIVVEDRGTNSFRSDSAATNGALKLALRCAAVAAKHPQLTDAWLSLCSSLDKAAPLLSAVQPNYHGNISNILHTLVKETTHVPYPPPTGSSLTGPWELAATRRTHTTKVSYQHSWSLRRVLLDAIHGFYLKALARMPGASRYHRSMLKAGHCYGPFDPVSNIILNTIWYQDSFPPLTPQREFDFVGSRPNPSTDSSPSSAPVTKISACTRPCGSCSRRISTCPRESIAAVSRKNMKPLARLPLQHGTPTPILTPKQGSSVRAKPEVLSLLSNGGQEQLSSQVVQQLATLLSSGMSTQQQQRPVSVSKREFNDTMAEGSERRRAYKRISRKVKDALRRYEKQNSGDNTCYQLRVVCGVNESVSGPDNSEEFIMERDDTYDEYYHHTHANFLVTRNVGSVCSVPVLFFAELSNDGDDDQLLYCPVDIPSPGAEPVRCLFCEHAGIRIVHPADREGFHGRALEFEKMVRGEDFYDNGYYPEVYSNHRILRRSESIADWREGGLEEDCMYLGSNDFTIEEDDGDESEDFEDD